VRTDETSRTRRLQRIWRRAGISCLALLTLALVLPRVQRALDPQAERRAIAQSIERTARERAPVFVLPNGERRRAVAVARADPTPVDDARSDRALWWWCGILAAVIITGAVAQSVAVRLGEDDDDDEDEE